MLIGFLLGVIVATIVGVALEQWEMITEQRKNRNPKETDWQLSKALFYPAFVPLGWLLIKLARRMK
jgi:hypothetical protein